MDLIQIRLYPANTQNEVNKTVEIEKSRIVIGKLCELSSTEKVSLPLEK